MEILFLIIFAACLAARFTVWKEEQPWQWKWICKPLAVGLLPVTAVLSAAKVEDVNFFSVIFVAWLPITQLPDQTEAFQDKEMRPARAVKPLPAEAAPAERTQATTLEQEATAAAEHGDDPFADLIH